MQPGPGADAPALSSIPTLPQFSRPNLWIGTARFMEVTDAIEETLIRFIHPNPFSFAGDDGIANGRILVGV